MSFFAVAALPSASQSALAGMASASAAMASAAQEVAEVGIQGMDGDVVSLSNEPRMVDGLIGLVAADAIYTANATVARLSDGLFQDLMGTLDDSA
jgi:hypothetical protein